MILQALYDYYQKHQNELPAPGFEKKELSYLIVIRDDGSFERLENLMDAKKKTGQFFSVPRGKIRTVAPNANLLWDNCGYVLEYGEDEKEKETSKKKNELFVLEIEKLPDELKQTREIHAVLEFYRKGEKDKVLDSEEWKICTKKASVNLSFRLSDQINPVFSEKSFRDYVSENALKSTGPGLSGCCLVTGKNAPLCRTMKSTPIFGGQSTAALVSFQKNSGYDSYGKEQCFNAPISGEAEFACTTALNTLLDKESKNKFRLGVTTAVFWIEKKIQILEEFSLEQLIPTLAQDPKTNTEESITAMRKLCEAAYSGKLPAEDQNVKYYFLGLAPNAARISVRFWKTGTVGELAENIAQHFNDLRITGDDRPFPPLSSLLATTVHENKMENVPPNLTGKMFEAIFNGTQYPQIWMNLCLQRVHADGKVSPRRASILKACVNRKNRLQHTTHINKEISMEYDPENPNAAYQCGALFAVLVKAQENANPNLNANISDKFFASASTRPATVFGTLLILNRAHLKKLSAKQAIYFERMISELTEKLGTEFPTYLPPDDQGRFCLGYYQKRQEFFTAKKDKEDQTSDDTSTENMSNQDLFSGHNNINNNDSNN